MAGAVVGIDLGTTNTVVAAVRGGKAVVLADEEGNRLLPSVVSFPPNGEIIVGKKARDRRLVDARNTVYSVKRLIGRSWSSEEVDKARKRFPFELREGPTHGPLVVARNETYTLPEISAFVLRRAKEIAEKSLGETVDRAVVTVPASFNDLQRASTKVAAREAGLEVLRILNEPTAAALAYGFGKTGNERLAIYDFGGGTFDVTLLDLSGNVFEVISTAGDSFLGGDDIDLAIADRIAMNVIQQTRFDPRSDVQLMERLRAAAEHVKMALSSQDTASASLDELGYGPGGTPISTTFTMTRAELEQLIANIVQRTFTVCVEAMQLARAQPSAFDTAILVGGSTRIPLVRKRVEEYFGKRPLDRVNPDEVVAIGAAIQGAALTGAERRRAQTPMQIANPGAVTATRIQTLGGIGGAGGKSGTQGSRGPLAPPPPPRTTGRMLGAPIESTSPHEEVTAVPGRLQAEQIARARAHEDPTLNRATHGLQALGDESLDELTNPTAAIAPAPYRAVVTQAAMIDPSPPSAAIAAIAPRPPPLRMPAVTEPFEDDLPTAQKSTEGLKIAGPRVPTTTALFGSGTEPTGLRGAPSGIAFAPLDFGLPGDAVTATGTHGDEKTSEFAREKTSDYTADDWAAPPSAPTRPKTKTLPPMSISARQTPAPGSTPPPAPSVKLPSMPQAPATPQLDASMPVDIASSWPTAAGGGSFANAPLLIDVTPLSLSVETVGGFIDRVIARNTTVPCAQTRTFTTSKDSQQVIKLRVCQGESDNFTGNTALGELMLSGLRPARRGEVSIEVTFELDADGILNVRARDLETSNETAATMKLIGLDNPGASRASPIL